MDNCDIAEIDDLTSMVYDLDWIDTYELDFDRFELLEGPPN